MRCRALLSPQSPEETSAGCRDVHPNTRLTRGTEMRGTRMCTTEKFSGYIFFGKTFLVSPYEEETSVTFSRLLLRLVKLRFGGTGRRCWKRGHQNLSRSWGCPSARWWDWQWEVGEKPHLSPVPFACDLT